MANPPTNEQIIFPNAIDSLPTVYDAGSAAVAERYTKIWAEYHNKIRNFIGTVQPMLTPNTATSDGSLKGLTLYTLNPAPTIHNIIRGFAKDAFDAGRHAPTQVLPFEIVITSSNDDYSHWPNTGGGTTPLIYQTTQTILNQIVGNINLFHLRPMTQITLRRSSPFIQLDQYSSRWIVNHYAIPGADTLLIRGCLCDLNDMAPIGSQLPPLNEDGHFPNGDDQYLNVVLMGVRRSGDA